MRGQTATNQQVPHPAKPYSLVHPVLLVQGDNSSWMPLPKTMKQAHIQSSIPETHTSWHQSLQNFRLQLQPLLGLITENQRRELVVVSHQNKGAGIPERTQANWKCDLRGLVNHTNIKKSSVFGKCVQIQ